MNLGTRSKSHVETCLQLLTELCVVPCFQSLQDRPTGMCHLPQSQLRSRSLQPGAPLLLPLLVKGCCVSDVQVGERGHLYPSRLVTWPFLLLPQGLSLTPSPFLSQGPAPAHTPCPLRCPSGLCLCCLSLFVACNLDAFHRRCFPKPELYHLHPLTKESLKYSARCNCPSI